MYAPGNLIRHKGEISATGQTQADGQWDPLVVRPREEIISITFSVDILWSLVHPHVVDRHGCCNMPTWYMHGHNKKTDNTHNDIIYRTQLIILRRYLFKSRGTDCKRVFSPPSVLRVSVSLSRRLGSARLYRKVRLLSISLSLSPSLPCPCRFVGLRYSDPRWLVTPRRNPRI